MKLNEFYLMFCRTVVRISSEPSQCHSIAASGVPVCMVPNAKYEILEFGPHVGNAG